MDGMIMYAVKLTVGLVGVLLVLRLMGKKELAQITPLDFVYALILGGIIEESLYDPAVPVYEMLFSLFYWALLIFVLEKISIKSPWFKRIAQGGPEVLIENGKLNIKSMKRNNMDVDEVRMLLRMQGVFSVSEVKYGILEESGQLSVMQNAREEPPTRKETMEDFEENTMPVLLIDAGKIEYKRLEELGLDKDWLREKIKEDTGEELENIYFAEWSEEDGMYTQTQNK